MAGLPQSASAAVRRLNPCLFEPAASDQSAPAAAERATAGIVSDDGDERELHDGFERWLRVHEPPLPYIHSRMDRKSTIRQGWPDFSVTYMGKVATIEFKMPGRTLDPEQVKVHEELKATQTPVKTCYTVLQAIEFCRETLGV